VQIFCPEDGEEMSATFYRDGKPIFVCYHCGNELRVARYDMHGVCANCEGAIPACVIDYLCGRCRHAEKFLQNSP
jgi:Zn finger protein HypA/HybF involved in hydrogenase expression